MGNQPNIANFISGLDSSTLQSLLGALQQNPIAPSQQPPASVNLQPNIQPAPNLASVLGMLTRQNNPMPTIPPPAQQFPPPPSFGQPPANPIPSGEANLAALLAKGQLPQTNPAQIQNIMEQLSKWKR